MKRIILLLTFIITSSSLTAQSKYETGMRKAFDLWEQQKQWEAANLFERIAQAETDNWLPPFYVAQINTFYSFDEKDKEKMVAQMKRARDFLNDAKALSKDNAEILVLEAQLLTAWIVYDGQQYGMKYSAKIAELYQKAYELEPDNPRVVLGKAEWAIGTAKYFGQPTDSFCGELDRAAELFANFKPAGDFHPQGGGERVAAVKAENCSK